MHGATQHFSQTSNIWVIGFFHGRLVKDTTNLVSHPKDIHHIFSYVDGSYADVIELYKKNFVTEKGDKSCLGNLIGLRLVSHF